jgi:hypothetical protein
MGTAAKPTRENRTSTVDLRDEATYGRLRTDGTACVECVRALLLSRGFQLKHQATCRGSGCRSGGRVRGANPCSRSCRISSYAIARGDRTWLAMPWWPPRADGVENGGR